MVGKTEPETVLKEKAIKRTYLNTGQYKKQNKNKTKTNKTKKHWNQMQQKRQKAKHVENNCKWCGRVANQNKKILSS